MFSVHMLFFLNHKEIIFFVGVVTDLIYTTACLYILYACNTAHEHYMHINIYTPACRPRLYGYLQTTR